jgi:hypothetical protein
MRNRSFDIKYLQLQHIVTYLHNAELRMFRVRILWFK